MLILALKLDKYEKIVIILLIIASIATIYFLYKLDKNFEKEEVTKKNNDIVINEEKKLFVDLNIELKVIDYLLSSNKTISDPINSKSILQEVGVDEVNK